jgi:DNA processing protein
MFEPVAMSEHELKLFGLLTADAPAHVDQLLISSGLSSSELMAALLGLEMKDRIRQLPGKSFVKRI